MPNSSEETYEYIELYNNGDSEVDAEGYYIELRDNNGDVTVVEIDSSTTKEYENESTVVPDGGFLAVTADDYEDLDEHNDILDNAEGSLRLYDNHDRLLDAVEYPLEGEDSEEVREDKTIARIPDGGMWVDPVATPGEPTKLSDIPEDYLEDLREEAIEECFDDEEYEEDSQEKICSRDVLYFLELLEDEDEDEINEEFWPPSSKQEKKSDQSSVTGDQDISGESGEEGESEGEGEAGEENFVEKEVEIEFSGEPELKEGLELEAKKKIEVAELKVSEDFEGEVKVEIDLSKLELEEPGEFEFSAQELFDEEFLESEKIKLISPKSEDIVWQAEVSDAVEEVGIEISGELRLSGDLEEDSRDLKIEEVEVSGWEGSEEILEMDLEELDKVKKAGKIEVRIEDLDLEGGAEIVSHDQDEVVLEIEVEEKDEEDEEEGGAKEKKEEAKNEDEDEDDKEEAE